MAISKKALLIISYGTRHPDARKSIENIEKYISDKYSDFDFFRAFTSRSVISKIEHNENLHIATPYEALHSIIKIGYSELVCQPTNIINGTEYEIISDLIVKSSHMFDTVHLGSPLLSHLNDYEHITKIYKPIANENEHLLLVGHGTKHHSNSAYCMLEEYFRYKGINNVTIGTIESFPSIDYVIEKLKSKKVKTVTLMPFMIVAGNHAKEDIAGESSDSWKNQLLNAGFNVNISMESLGQFQEISKLFYTHSKNSFSMNLCLQQKNL